MKHGNYKYLIIQTFLAYSSSQNFAFSRSSALINGKMVEYAKVTMTEPIIKINNE
jgi:hypothetical protein